TAAPLRQKILQNPLRAGVARASCPCFMGGTPMSRGGFARASVNNVQEITAYRANTKPSVFSTTNLRIRAEREKRHHR
ncbi:MAG: hypothetical protein PHS50_00905, partial [Kiritimatiellae bacterium]|nr:hypothetical protein [Kiritimatiellia bacterium]